MEEVKLKKPKYSHSLNRKDKRKRKAETISEIALRVGKIPKQYEFCPERIDDAKAIQIGKTTETDKINDYFEGALEDLQNGKVPNSADLMRRAGYSRGKTITDINKRPAFLRKREVFVELLKKNEKVTEAKMAKKMAELIDAKHPYMHKDRDGKEYTKTTPHWKTQMAAMEKWLELQGISEKEDEADGNIIFKGMMSQYETKEGTRVVKAVQAKLNKIKDGELKDHSVSTD